MPESADLTLAPQDYSLLTDLYQLTMAACYAGEGVHQQRASFELFARHLPPDCGYLVAMGLEQGLAYLQQWWFSPQQIEALQATGLFENAPEGFWSLLAEGSFSGDVWAVPEGTPVGASEPILRVEAPLWQAQLAETYLLNAINYQTLVATRAARLREAAGEGARLLEFGTRRAFSPQASLWAARAALAAGLDATSNILAALQLGRQPSGTMAHSLVMAIGTLRGGEDEAFAAFHRYFPQAPLLIDTYDTVAAARRLARWVQQGQMQVRGVRIDSGDIAALSQQVRSLLPETAIFASGDLDEHEVEGLVRAQAAIDGYGIGTQLVTGSPVNGVYKLVDIGGEPTLKQSSDKETHAGRKQILRRWDGDGAAADRLGTAEEPPQTGERALLECVMAGGERTRAAESLQAIQQRVRSEVAQLPLSARRLQSPVPLPVAISPALQQLDRAARARGEHG
ncbi:MAG: nicotinate phosphoribosyltransferase [Cyanobacteria bacterium QS_8_64_29]|nr:MAG: nicotinate phosphoribosyltransferase [Cyanobacteria bacterium QS_8_64_29]